MKLNLKGLSASPSQSHVSSESSTLYVNLLEKCESNDNLSTNSLFKYRFSAFVSGNYGINSQEQCSISHVYTFSFLNVMIGFMTC